MIRVTIAALVLAVAGTAPASAEPRPAHGGFGGGSYLGLTGAEWGPIGVADYYPGGGFGRFGLRGELRGYEGLEHGHAVAGVVYEAAAARPRLLISLHAGVGLSWTEVRPLVAGGIETQLWVLGPLSLVSGTDLVLRIDGIDTALAISGTLQLRLAW